MKLEVSLPYFQNPATDPKLSHYSSFRFTSIILPFTPSSAQDVSSLQVFC